MGGASYLPGRYTYWRRTIMAANNTRAMLMQVSMVLRRLLLFLPSPGPAVLASGCDGFILFSSGVLSGVLFLFSSIAFSNAFGFIYWFIISSGLWPYKAGFVNNIGINGALCRRNILYGQGGAPTSLLIVNKFLKINTTFFLDYWL